jgi:4a-hydroxytetrahydrobiopterin dehydratase
MVDMKKLDNIEIKDELERLNGWIFDGKYLCKDYKFHDFVDAFSFMTKVAGIAESIDHHPDWANVYNSVAIKLYTHDANSITAMDFLLAKRIDEIEQ